MKKRNRIAGVLAGVLAGAGAALLLATGAQAAATSVVAARVGAVNANALAKFYETVFSLHEVNRFQLTTGVEIVLGFGNDAAAAKSNRGTQIFVNHRTTDNVKDLIPHLILHVDDLDATVKAIAANGGTVVRKPFNFHNVVTIAIAKDPVGNLVEMIQTPERPAR